MNMEKITLCTVDRVFICSRSRVGGVYRVDPVYMQWAACMGSGLCPQAVVNG